MMESAVEKEYSAFGGLFQHIIGDLKNSTPIWEDFLMKASKFHSQLKATVATSSSFLDAFQRIADMATNTRGATKEIGSALTRLCLRQRSVESKLKTFSNTLQESLILPLQEKLEDWKKMASYLDKEHSKECKRAKQELKKKSSDTLRLQKKVRKVGVIDIRRTLDYALQDVTDMYLLLEETEKQSVRKALIEERSHFCFFVGYLQPVLESEIKMLNEINHLEEIIDTLSKITGDPHLLPLTSEQVIADIKSTNNAWSFHSPPSSPGSLGSRKSSVCSISSVHSSSSGSLKGHRQLSYCQYPSPCQRYTSVTSQDSGFASEDTLFYNCSLSSVELAHQISTLSEAKSSTLSTPSSPLPSVTSTWPNLQETEPFEVQTSQILKYQRPHTISSAYEKSNHNRPALTAHTFEPLDHELEPRSTYASVGTFKSKKLKDQLRNHSQPGTPLYHKPCIPERNEDINKEKPSVPEKSQSVRAKHGFTNRSLPDFNMTPADQVVPHPVYANTSELAHKGTSEAPVNIIDSKEMQNQKGLATVLTEGLQSIKLKNENPPMPPVVPARPQRPNANVGVSETLPRSRDSAIEEAKLMQWHMYSMSLYSANRCILPAGMQRRPASIAGVTESFQIPRKANTLQRIVSTPGNKPPPTPVRRSSSITAAASPSNGGTSFRNSVNTVPVSSGAGEVCYSPNRRDLFKSTVEIPLVRGRSYSPMRRMKRDYSSDCEGNDSSSSINGIDSDSEDSIVTDVSGSRARLIQDLNSTLQQQHRKSVTPSSLIQTDPPIVPLRHSSRQQESSEAGFQKSESGDNPLYGYCTRSEKRSKMFNAKPVSCQDFAKNYQRKSLINPSRCDARFGEVLENPFSHHNALSVPPAHVEEKKFKVNFMAALNAKLAQHHQQNSPHSADIEKHVPQSLFCRESLMDQIKRGTTLRRVSCNDRSSPRIA